MLTLGWSDGSTFLPINSVLLSSENKRNRINEASAMDKRTVGYKRRQLSMQKGTSVMLELLKHAKSAAIPEKYVLFDSWFSSPSSIHAVKGIGYDVIAMVKKTPKMFFRYNGEEMSETETNGKSICVSFQQILDWMKMKLSASTEKDGILKSFSKSAKVTCIWVKNADPSPMMR